MVTVERASIDDVEAFMALEREPDIADLVLPDARADHLAKLADPATVYLRILCEGQRVGFFILVLEGDGATVEFQRIVVARRGAGVGQAAIAALHRFCRDELGRRRIWLDVFADNARARHVYEKLGYREVDCGSGTGAAHAPELVCYERAL